MSRKSVGLAPLVAATYFMVSGGPFGLEDLIGAIGYRASMAVLLLTPLVWSVPTAMAVGELSAAYPEDGGYYVWVRRALGPFWGVQEAWLSLAASLFDLALYPTLFTRYLGEFWPQAASGVTSVAVGVALIVLCTWVNLRGAEVATDASVVLGVLLLLPFAVLSVTACLRDPGAIRALSGPLSGSGSVPEAAGSGLFAGLAIAMWNYMGWDNASTIAGEVRDPGRTYPRTMAIAVALVAFTYLVPVAATAHTSLPPGAWTEGSWARLGHMLGGRWLGGAIALAGMISAGGMLSSLVMSYGRLPLVLADHGYLPRRLAVRDDKTGAPVTSLVVCAVAYSACLGLGFKRLVELDVLIYGASLVLEFVALAVLRAKEPSTPRPFRVPGGRTGVALVGLVPTALLGWLLFAGGTEEGGGTGWTVLSAAGFVALGPLLYFARRAKAESRQPA
jgi:amino acid transporter